MSTALSPFTFAGQQVRVVTDEQGEPWFVASDVTALLGYRNGRDAVAGLPERMKSSVVLSDGTPGNPNRAVLNEAGVNRLIMRSTLPAAERIQDWLAEEVMPTIRRTGGYGVGSTDTLPAIPQTYADALREAANQYEARMVAEAKVAELEPKADLADTFLVADGTSRLVREVAKLLGMRERDLRRFLVEQKFLFVKHAACGDVMYDFRSEFAHHFVAKEVPVQHTFGTCSHYTIRITARGIELIRKRLRGEGTLAASA